MLNYRRVLKGADVSMKKVIIFGIDQFAELLTHFLEQEKKYEIAAYTVERPYIDTLSIQRNKAVGYNYLVVPFDEIEKHCPPEQYEMFICIGYNKMNNTRKRIFEEAAARGYRILSYIHPTATVLTEDIGEGTIVMERAVIGAFVKMGKGNVFWADAHVAHHTVIGDFNFFTISTAVAGNISIGNNCFFGNNCTIKNGIRIADYSLIGAGCYVSRSTEPYSVHVPVRSVVLEGKSSLDMNLTLKRE